MMLFVAANDLLTMFVALEVFSLPLYLLCALARRRRLLSQEAALKYFLLGAFASAFFLFGMALLYGFAGTRRPRRRSASAVARRDGGDVLLCSAWRCSSSACCSRRRRAVPRLDAGRLPGRADAGHRVHGGLHQGRRVRRAAAACSTSRFGPSRVGLAAGDLRVAILTMLVGAILGGDPDRHQAPARLLVDRERRLPAGRRARR